MKMSLIALAVALTACTTAVDRPAPAVPISSVPRIACVRFEDPLNRDPYPVRGALIRNRVVPLKVELRDAAGAFAGPSAIPTPPVVRVFIGETDRTDLAGPMDTGEQQSFVFMRDGDKPEGHWKYDLVLEDFPVPSLLRVTIASGDEREYTIDPPCVARIAIE